MGSKHLQSHIQILKYFGSQPQWRDNILHLLINPSEEIGLPEGGWTRVCVFMNVFDVHVNRSPMLGEITYKNYIPGSFFNASLDKASSENERMIIWMDTENGKKIAFVQIAGLVARRIICDVDIGSSLKAGEIFPKQKTDISQLEPPLIMAGADEGVFTKLMLRVPQVQYLRVHLYMF